MSGGYILQCGSFVPLPSCFIGSSGWTSQVFHDSVAAETALSSEWGRFVEQDDFRRLIPEDIWRHISHLHVLARIQGFRDLFILLNTDPKVNDLRRNIFYYFVKLPVLRDYLSKSAMSHQSKR
jgi:hypothetical protein